MNKEVTIVYLTEVTEILTLPEEEEYKLKDLADNRKADAAKAMKDALGVDDVVVNEIKYFIRDLPKQPDAQDCKAAEE